MNDESEDTEDEEEGLEYVEIEEGKLIIYDLQEFKEKTNSLAIHVTMDDGIFVLTEDLVWKSFSVDVAKATSRPKPTLVK